MQQPHGTVNAKYTVIYSVIIKCRFTNPMRPLYYKTQGLEKGFKLSESLYCLNNTKSDLVTREMFLGLKFS